MVYNREEAAKRAEASHTNVPGTCQLWTRTMFDAPSAGDQDHDGDSDAVDGWESEPVSKRHTDRNPPRGVPVAWSGGSHGYGHRAISLGNGMIRSTDAGGSGHIATVDLAWPERNWGLHYLGWSETIDGQQIPLAHPLPPAKKTKTLKFQHTSMQFSDTDAQMASDAERIFSRGRDVLTGTEAGGEKSKPLPDLLRAAAKKHGYRLQIGKGDWIAVSQELVSGGWDEGYVPVIEAREGQGPHTDRGIPWVSFDTAHLGHITVGVGHYLTNGRKPGDPNYMLNRRYAAAIGKWARENGRGTGIVFYGGDQNMVDRTGDTFLGAPLTSAWDELNKHENTGHGNIDVIASYDHDGRVKATGIRALDDKEFHLNTDHFLVEAEYEIEEKN